MVRGSISSSESKNGNCIQTITTQDYGDNPAENIHRLEQDLLLRVENHIIQKIDPDYKISDKFATGGGGSQIGVLNIIHMRQNITLSFSNDEVIFGVHVDIEDGNFRFYGTDKDSTTQHSIPEGNVFGTPGDPFPRFTISSNTVNYTSTPVQQNYILTKPGLPDSLYNITVNYVYTAGPPKNLKFTIAVTPQSPATLGNSSDTQTIEFNYPISIVSTNPTTYNMGYLPDVSIPTFNHTLVGAVYDDLIFTLGGSIGPTTPQIYDGLGLENPLPAYINPNTGDPCSIGEAERGYLFYKSGQTVSTGAAQVFFNIMFANVYQNYNTCYTIPSYQTFSSFFYDDMKLAGKSGTLEYFTGFLLKKGAPYSAETAEITDPTKKSQIEKMAKAFYDAAVPATKFLQENSGGDECTENLKQYQRDSQIICGTCLQIKFA